MTARKELLRQYKDTRPATGVYRVHNTANGRMLIGSSADIRARLNRHIAELRVGAGRNKLMQHDDGTCGADAFVFETLEALEPLDAAAYKPDEDLQLLEQIWLDKLLPLREQGGDSGYHGSARARS